MRKIRFKSGFTLAEVLIALALLGVVAAFAIPKVLQTVDASHKKAVFRETVGMISDALSEAYLSGSFTGNADPIFTEKLNILYAEPPVVPGNGCTMNYGYILKNGARVLYSDCAAIESFYVDYDGLNKGPNQAFSDIMTFWANMGTTTCCCGIKPGGVGVVNPQICPGDQPPWASANHTTQEFYDFFTEMIVK